MEIFLSSQPFVTAFSKTPNLGVNLPRECPSGLQLLTLSFFPEVCLGQLM